MATYLVLKRVKEDTVSLPGELLVDPPNAQLLIERGYLTPVPDNYPGAVSKVVPPPADSPKSRPVARATTRR
jgi:hypothetical protein